MEPSTRENSRWVEQWNMVVLNVSLKVLCFLSAGTKLVKCQMSRRIIGNTSILVILVDPLYVLPVAPLSSPCMMMHKMRETRGATPPRRQDGQTSPANSRYSLAFFLSAFFHAFFTLLLPRIFTECHQRRFYRTKILVAQLPKVTRLHTGNEE